MAARYWRLVALDTWGAGVLRLWELHVYDAGGRIDGGATLTASHTPTAGSLSNLKDASTGTLCEFSRAQYVAPGFFLRWDFGSDVTPTELRLTADTLATFPESFRLERSANGVEWFVEAAGVGLSWPGVLAVATLTLTAVEESFTTDPTLPGRTQTWMSSPTVTWDSGGGALQAVEPTALAGIGVTTVPSLESREAAWVEMDLRLTSDTDSRKHIGVFLGMREAGVFSGYRFATLDGGSVISRWLRGAETGLVAAPGPTGGVNPLVLGTTHTFRVERTTGGAWTFSVDGVVLRTVTDVAHYTAFEPGIFVYRGTIKCFAVRTSAKTIPGGTKMHRTAASLATASFHPQASPAWSTRGLAGVTPASNTEHGAGTVTGTTAVDSTPDAPISRRVRLYRDRDGLFMGEVWSDPVTGAFAFPNLSTNFKYTALSYDHEGIFRAVVADNLTAEVA